MCIFSVWFFWRDVARLEQGRIVYRFFCGKWKNNNPDRTENFDDDDTAVYCELSMELNLLDNFLIIIRFAFNDPWPSCYYMFAGDRCNNDEETRR